MAQPGQAPFSSSSPPNGHAEASSSSSSSAVTTNWESNLGAASTSSSWPPSHNVHGGGGGGGGGEEDREGDRGTYNYQYTHPDIQVMEHNQQQQQQQQNLFGIPYRGNFSFLSDDPSVIRDDTWSCIIVVLTFWFFGLFSLPFPFLSFPCLICSRAGLREFFLFTCLVFF